MTMRKHKVKRKPARHLYGLQKAQWTTTLEALGKLLGIGPQPVRAEKPEKAVTAHDEVRHAAAAVRRDARGARRAHSYARCVAKNRQTWRPEIDGCRIGRNVAVSGLFLKQHA